jgi:hypothetical protein
MIHLILEFAFNFGPEFRGVVGASRQKETGDHRPDATMEKAVHIFRKNFYINSKSIDVTV